MNKATFDEFGANYDEALQKGIGLSGETKDFFAESRIRFLSRVLPPKTMPRVLDYGCGTGSATPFLLRLPGVTKLVGVDVSDRSLDRARQVWQQPAAEFHNLTRLSSLAPFDLVFCNGVFHHIPSQERACAFGQIHQALLPGGHLAFWENNPWNPGTRWVMSRIPFDRDAQMLWPRASRRALSEAGFRILQTHFAFIFPKALKTLRILEWPLRSFPFGAQYMILAKKDPQSCKESGSSSARIAKHLSKTFWAKRSG